MRVFITGVLIVFTYFLGFGQSYFYNSSVQFSQIDSRSSDGIFIQEYLQTTLNLPILKKALFKRKNGTSRSNTLEILIPDPLGNENIFLLEEYEMMEKGLAKKYPDIKTFQGRNKDNPTEKIHLGISDSEFYATVSSDFGSYSIDKISKDLQTYRIYYHAELRGQLEKDFICGFENKASKENKTITQSRNSEETIPLRTYRLALACTGEFGSFYGPEKENVLAEMVKSINRVNQIMENDLAIRLILAENNDKLIFVNAETDPYDDGNSGGALLNRNTTVINENIGFANYDVGHVFTMGCNDVGGVAFLSSICAGNKGGGVTCHYSSDINLIAVRVAAHEIWVNLY